MQQHWADAPEPDVNERDARDTSLMRFSVAAPLVMPRQGGHDDEPPSLVVLYGYWLNEIGFRDGGTLMVETDAGKVTMSLVAPAQHVMAVDHSNVKCRVFFIDIHADHIR